LQYFKPTLFFIFTAFLFSEQIEVTATIVKAQNLKKEVHFSGNVNIKKGDDWMRADSVVVYFDKNNQTKKYEATGNVKFEFKEKRYFYKGQANKVTYYPFDSLYILSGKAKIEDKITNRHLNGEMIKLNMITGKAIIKGTKRKPVKFIFDLGEKK
jgi:lipopolysaccharide export system protein LptA